MPGTTLGGKNASGGGGRWYEFRNKVQNETQLKKDAKKAEDEKNEKLQAELASRKRMREEIYAPRKFVKRVR